MYEVMVEKTFDAAHFLENYDGPCARMHGHTYRVQVTVEGETLDDKFGMLMDFTEVKRHLNVIIERLDHQLLNDVLDFSTTSELLAKYFYDELVPSVPSHCRLKQIRVWETPSCCATYYR